MIKKNRTAFGIGAALATLLIVGGVPAAAGAAETQVAPRSGDSISLESAHQSDAGILAVTNASGSRSCRSGEQVYIRMTLTSSGKAAVAGNFRAQAAVGLDHFFLLGVRSANWQAAAPNGIQTINDGCTSM